MYALLTSKKHLINRSMLWNVLRKAELGGKVLKNLQSLYKIVKSCVWCHESLTDFFDCPREVRQGGVLSPIFFSFFINKLVLDVAENGLQKEKKKKKKKKRRRKKKKEKKK